MRKESTTMALLGLASIAAALTLFVLIFDRYVYYDYRDTECKAGAVMLHASLVGDVSSRDHKGRTNLYTTRVWVTSSDRYFGLLNVSLSSKQSGRQISVSDGQTVVDMDFYEKSKRHAFLAQPVHIDYDDYTLSGTLRSLPPADEVDASFSCALDRHRHSEWRWPWLDAVMSV